MKTAIIILGLVLLPSFFTYAQVTDKETGKGKVIYLIIRNVECTDCQGLGYLNTATFDFKRNDLVTSRSNTSTGSTDIRIARITCPYCGGTGKLEIREYRPKL